MSRKPPPPAFQPAPRPRLSHADAAMLSEVTADLGFARAVSVPETPADVAPPPRPAQPAPRPDVRVIAHRQVAA